VGMLMGFYVGDKRQIGDAFSSPATSSLWTQPFVVAWADFSLHLSPLDLDLLSEEACRIVHTQPVTLTGSLIERVGGDGETSSADVVAPHWVEAVARIPDDRIEELATRWFAQIAAAHQEQPEPPSPDTLQALNELVQACRVATEKNLAVVHTWCL
jgi:hypothetical protein